MSRIAHSAVVIPAFRCRAESACGGSNAPAPCRLRQMRQVRACLRNVAVRIGPSVAHAAGTPGSLFPTWHYTVPSVSHSRSAAHHGHRTDELQPHRRPRPEQPVRHRWHAWEPRSMSKFTVAATPAPTALSLRCWRSTRSIGCCGVAVGAPDRRLPLTLQTRWTNGRLIGASSNVARPLGAAPALLVLKTPVATSMRRSADCQG